MVTAAGVAALLGIGTTAATAVAIVVDVVINFAIGKLAQLLASQQGLPQNIQTITIRGTIQPLSIIYGQVATSGVIVWEGTSGDHNQYLWYVIALAGHQCEAITDVWLDSQVIRDASIDPSTGQVTDVSWGGKLYIWRYLGASSDTGIAALLSSNNVPPFQSAAFSNSFHGVGVAKIVVRCEADSMIFPNGAPQTIRALVKGKRVYDPRLDSTNGGSGSQRVDHPGTWTWSANPALCLADYFHGGSIFFDQATALATLGMGLTTDRVDWSFAAAAANVCDETVSVPSGTQARYALGLVLSAGDTHGTNVDKILATMIGQRIWVSGKYRIYAGAYDEPSCSIDDDDLTADGYSVQGASSQSDLYNTVSGTYYDPSRDWQQEPCAARTQDEYIAEDGGTLLKNIALDGITDEYRAQRISNVTANLSRNQITVALNLKLSGAKLAPWETFNLTLQEEGWTDKVFRALEISADLGARRLQVSGKEENPGAYDDLAVADYAAVGDAAPTSSIERPSPPISLTAISAVGAVVLQWTASIYFPSGSSYEVYEGTAASPFSAASKIATGTVTTLVIPKSDTTTRYYWVLARSAQGQASDVDPTSNGVPGQASKVGELVSADNLDEVPDGVTYGRALAAYLSGGRPWSYKGAYSSSTIYNRGDEVESGGNYYLYINTSASSGHTPPNATYWQLIGPTSLDQLADGGTYAKVLATYVSAGVPFTYKGAYSNTAAYTKGDEVSYSGNYYLCTVPSPAGTLPTDTAHWALLGPTSMDSIPDGATYAKIVASFLNANRPISLYIPDTRSTNQPPSWYRGTYPNRNIVEFKQRSVIGVPGAATFVLLETHVPLSDTSGGPIIQYVNSSDGVYTRKGSANDATWGAWLLSYDNQNKPNLDSDVLDGTTYAKVLADYLESGRPFAYQGVYGSSFTYHTGDELSYNGNYYLAIGDPPAGTLPTNSTYFALLGPTSLDVLPDGTTYGKVLADYLAAGRPFQYRGPYSASATYHKGDEISSNGQYYVYVNGTAGAGNAPPNSNYWQVIGTATLFAPVNTCIVGDDSVQRPSGANWDSGACSLVAYPNCHISAKVNFVGQNMMIGLMSPANASRFQSYPVGGGAIYALLDYAIHARGANDTWVIYESGVEIETVGNTALTDEAAITFDGATLTYYINRRAVLQRSLPAGLTFYGAVALYESYGVNSLDFGPTSAISQTDTYQVSYGAITLPSSSSNSSPFTMSTTWRTVVSVSVTVPTGELWDVLVTGSALAYLGFSPTGDFILTLDGAFGTNQGTVQGAGWGGTLSNTPFTAGFDYTTTLGAGTHTFAISCINTSGGATFESAFLQVSLLKR
jgi:hypothetical protein